MDFEKNFKLLPVLATKKNPTAALVVGFLFGGIGLAIYFRKVIDFFIPIFVNIVLVIFHSQLQGQGFIYVLFGAAVAAVYGYLRAMYSNQVLEERAAAGTGASPATPATARPAPTTAVAGGYDPAPGTGFGQPPAAGARQWWENTAGGSPAVGAEPPPSPPAAKPWWEK